MKAYAPTGSPIVALADLIPGNALITDNSFHRDEHGAIQFDYVGETELCWNGQYTREDDRGVAMFVDEAGELWPEDQINLEGEDPREAPPSLDKPAKITVGVRAMNLYLVCYIDGDNNNRDRFVQAENAETAFALWHASREDDLLPPMEEVRDDPDFQVFLVPPIDPSRGETVLHWHGEVECKI